MTIVDVLLPTYNRLPSLIMTLSGLAAQTVPELRVIVADQSAEPANRFQVIQTLQRVIEARGGAVERHHRPSAHGIAEQRDFLLRRATAEQVLYVDDIFMEPWDVERLVDTLRSEDCGFVGASPVGVSFRDDLRPHQQAIECWEGPVRPEIVEPGSHEWKRAALHSAANLYHVSLSLPPGEVRRYKVAWVGACAICERAKPWTVGGFSFGPRLPRYHSGEEVLVQNLLLRRWGGCAIIPSGTYHAEVPTTVLNAAGVVDGHALELLPEMVDRYTPSTD